MSNNLTPIDLSHLSHPNDWLRIVEEVATTKTPRELKRNSKTVAILMPVETTGKPKKKQTRSQKNYERVLAAAGSLKGYDSASI